MNKKNVVDILGGHILGTVPVNCFFAATEAMFAV